MCVCYVRLRVVASLSLSLSLSLTATTIEAIKQDQPTTDSQRKRYNQIKTLIYFIFLRNNKKKSADFLLCHFYSGLRHTNCFTKKSSSSLVLSLSLSLSLSRSFSLSPSLSITDTHTHLSQIRIYTPFFQLSLL